MLFGQPAVNTIIPGDAIKVTVILTSTANTSFNYMSNQYYVPTYTDITNTGKISTTVMVLVPDTDATYITTLTSFNAFNYSLYITRNNETQV